MVSTDPLIWMNAVLLLSLITLAWKDTPISKYAEQILLATFTAHLLVAAWDNIKAVGITKITQGNIVYVIPILLSIMAFAKYSKTYGWLSRYPAALMVGIGIGTATRGFVGGNVIDQIKASFLPLFIANNPIGSINNIIFEIILITSLAYFIFTYKQFSGPTAKKITTIGRYAMMAAFGYAFSATIVVRINSAAKGLEFLIKTWLQLGA